MTHPPLFPVINIINIITFVSDDVSEGYTEAVKGWHWSNGLSHSRDTLGKRYAALSNSPEIHGSHSLQP